MEPISVITERKRFDIRSILTFMLIFFISFSLKSVLIAFLGGISTFLYFTTRFGIVIIPVDGKLKHYVSLFGLRLFYNTSKLPDIRYVVVVRYLRGINYSRATKEPGDIVPWYNVNFILNTKRRYMTIDTFEYDNDALDFGLHIGEALDLKVLDFTTPESKWIR